MRCFRICRYSTTWPTGCRCAARSGNDSATRVEEMLALVNLSGYEKRMPAQLSGGQQQRVALARVLAPDPRVLLFDEPLSSLDRNLRDQLKHSIRELQQKAGKTAMFVTHDQSEAFAISDRIFVMNAGRIEQGGTQLELYMHPSTPFVAEFLGSNNCLHGVITDSPTGWNGLRWRCRCQVGSHTLHQRQSAARSSAGTRVLAYVRPENIAVLPDGRTARAMPWTASWSGSSSTARQSISTLKPTSPDCWSK